MAFMRCMDVDSDEESVNSAMHSRAVPRKQLTPRPLPLSRAEIISESLKQEEYQNRRSSVPNLGTAPCLTPFQSRPSLKPQPVVGAPRLEANERVLRRARTPQPPPVNHKVIPKTVAFGRTTKTAETVEGRKTPAKSPLNTLNRAMSTNTLTNVPHTLSAQVQSLQQLVDNLQHKICVQDKIIERQNSEINELRGAQQTLSLDMVNLVASVERMGDKIRKNSKDIDEIRKTPSKPTPKQNSNRLDVSTRPRSPLSPRSLRQNSGSRRRVQMPPLLMDDDEPKSENRGKNRSRDLVGNLNCTQSMIKYMHRRITTYSVHDEDELSNSSTSSHRKHRDVHYRDGLTLDFSNENRTDRSNSIHDDDEDLDLENQMDEIYVTQYR